MTQEQKAKAYDEALKKLRGFYRDYDTVSCLIDVKEELANIFPELRESEYAKLMQFRQWLIEETEHFQEQAKADNASSEGSHYDRGHAAAFISARAKLEELFDYWDCR